MVFEIDNTQTQPRKFDLIQTFRGIAAVLVLLHHTSLSSSVRNGYVYLGGLVTPGWAGVDFFFVLSGFIIFYISHKDIGNCNKSRIFITNRIKRIYPIYWLITLSIIVVFHFFSSLGDKYDTSPLVILKSIFLWPQQLPLLKVSWSLSYEMLFYLLFTLVIIFGMRFAFLITIPWILLILFKLVGILTFPGSNFLLNPHNLEFIAGCLAAYLTINKLPKSGYIYILLIGILGFILSWVGGMNHLILQDYTSGILCFGISSFFVILGASSIESRKVLKVPKSLIFLGDASYSIYLTHTPIIVALLTLFKKLNVLQHSGTFIQLTVIWIITLFFGLLCYKCIEKPLILYLRNNKHIPSKNQFMPNTKGNV